MAEAVSLPGSREDPSVGKNIVMCLDGTGNQLKAKGNTNVVRLYEMLDLSDPSKQIAYYDPGVGTFSAQGAWTPLGRWISKLAGLAFGFGLRANLGEAYTYLIQHYDVGDKLFVFGFSRGAYTCRALAGLLRAVGLLRPGSENLVPYAVGVYARNKDWSNDDWTQLHRFADTFCRKIDRRVAIPIDYMGVWDSVKAAGILRWNLRWLYTRQIPNVRSVRHAVSIDEKRFPYREYLIEPLTKSSAPTVDEVWFAGVHSDVGGTFEDDPRLPRITLKWIVDGALDAGVLLKPNAYQASCALVPENALGRVHRMGIIWALLTYRRRRLPANVHVHESVKIRIGNDSSYSGRIPQDVVWSDANWLNLR
jgi:uncharacterized protein (DUF2235 family)